MADSMEPTELDMLKLAAAADAGLESVPLDEPKVEEKQEADSSGDTVQEPAPAEEAETKQDASSEAPATEEKSEEAKSSLTTQPEDSKPDSASEKKSSRYEKAKSRLQKEWEDVQAEKARLKAEREALESQRSSRASSEAPKEEAKQSSRKFSPEDYREAAKNYRGEGRDDLAQIAEQRAAEVEAEERKEIEEKTKSEMKSAWDKNLLKEVEENPELKDSSSSLYKAVSEMLERHAILRNYPAGINDAVQIAKMRIKAETASGLEKKVAEYERELAQLRKATTPASGQPSAPAKQKAFHELSSADQEKELLRMAMEADRSNV